MQYNITNFKTLYGSAGTTFPDNTTGEISEGDLRQFGEDIADSFGNLLSVPMIRRGGFWNFADNAGAFPTAANEWTMYISEDEHGTIGDADYVPANTWFISKVNGANSFSQFSFNI